MTVTYYIAAVCVWETVVVECQLWCSVNLAVIRVEALDCILGINKCH